MWRARRWNAESCVCARASSFDRMRKITLHIWLIVLCRRVCLKYTGNNSLALARYLNVFRFHSFCSRSFTFCPSMPTACCLCDEWIVNVQLVHSQINCHYISFVMPSLLRVCTMWYHKSLWLWPLQSLAYCMRCAYHIHCKNFTQSNNKKRICNQNRRRTDLSESFTRCCMFDSFHPIDDRVLMAIVCWSLLFYVRCDFAV